MIEQDFTTTSRSLTVTNMFQLLHLLFCMSNFTLTRKANPSGYRKGPTTLCPNLRCSRADLFPLLGPFHVLKVWRNDVFHRTQVLQSSPWSRGVSGGSLREFTRYKAVRDGQMDCHAQRKRERSLIICNDTHTHTYIYNYIERERVGVYM